MEAYDATRSTEDAPNQSPDTFSTLLLCKEQNASMESKCFKRGTVEKQDKSTPRQSEPPFSEEELFDIEDLGTSTEITLTNNPSQQETPGFFSLNEQTLYQAGHSTLRRIQGAAEVAGNRITDWIKPLIPGTLTGTDSEVRAIHILGETYSFTRSQLAETKEKYPPEFVEDFKSRLWFTYRTGFPPIRPSEYVSDVGWGCMLRSAQMLLGQALVMMKLGRGWRKRLTSTEKQRTCAQIVGLFLDDIQAPFSIHNFCTQGRRLGKNIGEWFGPVTASQAIKALVNSYEALNLGAYVATDGVIYKDQLRTLIQDAHTPLLVLLPTRLGINTLNPIYFPAIKKLLELPQSLGIAGGKPSASLYFLAYEGDSLYYLDPHHARSATSTTTGMLTEEELSTYHCNDVSTINIQKIDPCMLFGFFCRDEEDIRSFLRRLEELSKECEAPILAVAHDTPMYLSDEEFDTFEEGFEMVN